MPDGISLQITDAGRAAMVAPDGTGTRAVKVAEVALGTGRYTPTPDQTTLASEFKRLDTVAGSAATASVIDVRLLDESADTYEVGEVGLFLDDGTLVAVFSQPNAALYEKAEVAPFAITFYVPVLAVDARNITFENISFATPSATEKTRGVMRIASAAEAEALSERDRVVTPARMPHAYRGLLRGAVTRVLPHVETDEHKLAVTLGDGTIRLDGGQSWIWRGMLRIEADDIPADARTIGVDPARHYHLRWHAPGTGDAVPAEAYPSGRVVLRDVTAVRAAGRADLGRQYDSSYDDMLIAECHPDGGALSVDLLINATRVRDRVVTSQAATPDGGNGASIEGRVPLDYAVAPTVSEAVEASFAGNVVSEGTTDQDLDIQIRALSRRGFDYAVTRDGARTITLTTHLMVD